MPRTLLGELAMLLHTFFPFSTPSTPIYGASFSTPAAPHLELGKRKLAPRT